MNKVKDRIEIDVLIWRKEMKGNLFLNVNLAMSRGLGLKGLSVLFSLRSPW